MIWPDIIHSFRGHIVICHRFMRLLHRIRVQYCAGPRSSCSFFFLHVSIVYDMGWMCCVCVRVSNRHEISEMVCFWHEIAGFEGS